MGAVGVVEVTTVAAVGGAVDIAQSKLDNFLKEMVGDLSAEELVGDCEVDGACLKTGGALETCFRFRG